MSAEVLRLYKAGDIRGIPPTPGAVIEMLLPMPEGVSPIGYGQQAGMLAALLMRTLPGGTIDRLLAELLTRKASSFRIAYDRLDSELSHLPPFPPIDQDAAA